MRLNHVSLAVADRERSAAFYGEHFGLTRRVHDDEHLLILGSEDGSLLALSDAAVPPGMPPTNHFGFQVPDAADVHRARERFAAAGVTEAEWQDSHGFVRVQVFDPDGYRVELFCLQSRQEVEISGELIGRLSEVDADRQSFQFTDRSGGKVPGAFSRRGLFAGIKGATDRTPDAPFVRLSCTYLTDLESNVTSVRDVDEVEILVGTDDPLGPRLRELLALPRGWRDGEGQAIAVEAIERVRDFAAELDEEDAAGLSLFPTLDGGVRVERQIAGRRWSLEVEDGEVTVTTIGDDGPDVQDASSLSKAGVSLPAFLDG